MLSVVSPLVFPPYTNKLSNLFAQLPCLSQQRLLQVSSHLTVSSSSSSVLPLHFPSLGLLSSLPCFQPALPLLFAWVVLWVWQLKPTEGGWCRWWWTALVGDGPCVTLSATAVCRCRWPMASSRRRTRAALQRGDLLNEGERVLNAFDLSGL